MMGALKEQIIKRLSNLKVNEGFDIVDNDLAGLGVRHIKIIDNNAIVYGGYAKGLEIFTIYTICMLDEDENKVVQEELNRNAERLANSIINYIYDYNGNDEEYFDIDSLQVVDIDSVNGGF